MIYEVAEEEEASISVLHNSVVFTLKHSVSQKSSYWDIEEISAISSYTKEINEVILRKIKFIDQLVKISDLDSARALFQRMATLDLQAKKMKFLFKKWLDFETGHGTEAGGSEVKQAAQKYLEGKGAGAEEAGKEQSWCIIFVGQ